MRLCLRLAVVRRGLTWSQLVELDVVASLCGIEGGEGADGTGANDGDLLGDGHAGRVWLTLCHARLRVG